jgi:hypothetical protein
MAKTELWWISVGGNKCEPARIVDKAIAFTIGCPDGIILAENAVDLIKQIEEDSIPLTVKESELRRLRWEQKVAADKKRGIYHGYRKFDDA